MDSQANVYRKAKAALLQDAALKNSTARGVRSLLKRLCQLTDATLIKLWDDAGFDGSMSLVAVGEKSTQITSKDAPKKCSQS